MEPKDRLAQVRDALGLKLSDFARTLGIRAGNYSNLETGRRPVNLKMLESLATRHAVNANWFLTGEGPMFQHEPEEPGKGVQVVYHDRTVVVDRQQNPVIKLVPGEAFAAYPLSIENGGSWDTMPEIGLSLEKFRTGLFRGFQVFGDEMEPRLCNGDWIIGRYVERPELVPPKAVCVVVTATGVCVRRVVADAGRKEIELQPDNRFYPRQLVPKAEVLELWQFECLMRFLVRSPERK